MTTETRKREWWLDKPEEFWISFEDGSYKRVEGKPVQLDGFGEMDLFLALTEFGWGVSDGVDGSLLGYEADDIEGYPTEHEALEAALEFLRDYSDRKELMEDRERNVAKWGLSPRYRWDDEEELNDD